MVIAKTTPKTGSFVDTNHVNSLLRTYKQERWIQNSKTLGKEDSLSAWYSLDGLQDFLDTARAHGADGIKMYFGVYDEQSAQHPEFIGRQTIVLVATKTKLAENGTYVDKSIYIHTEKGASILAFNMARICPPFCGGESTNIELDAIGTTLIDNNEGGMIVA